MNSPAEKSSELSNIIFKLRSILGEDAPAPKKGADLSELLSFIDKLIESHLKATTTIEQGNRMLAAINKASGTLIRASSAQELLESVCKALLTNEDFCLTWVGTKKENEDEITPIAAATTKRMKGMDCIKMVEQIAFRFDPEKNPAAGVFNTKEPVIYNDIFYGTKFKEFKEQAMRAGFSSYAALPLLWEKNFYGVLNIYSRMPGVFNKLEVEFLKNITTDIALALYSLDATRQLNRERELHNEIVEKAEALLISVMPCGAILTFNLQAEKITGYKRDDVKGKYWVDVLIPDEERKDFQQFFSRLLNDNSARHVSFQSNILCKNGDKKIINWHSTVMPDIVKGGEVGLIFIGIDITDQVKADKALEQARADWEQTFTAIHDPVMLVTPDGIILEANPATMNAVRKSREEIIGSGVCKILHGGRPLGVECPLEKLLKKKKSHILETQLRGLKGEYLLTISPIHTSEDDVERILLVARDLTEEKARRAEAIRASQLAAIGELAAGVAHEINNPINGIINYAQVLLDNLREDPMYEDVLKRIIHEGDRISNIVGNLLSFAKERKGELEMVDIAKAMDDSLSLIKHQLHKNGVSLEVDIQDGLPFVRGNAQQIQQVFLNLISNARHALNQRYPEADHRKKLIISVKTAKHNGNEYVRTMVTDYGIGIPQDLMDKVLEPFFSTKLPGEGTGLGLSISHGLVKDHKGFMQIESVLGDHTTVTVDLSVYSKEY